MRFEQSVHLPAPREVVWNLVADTERLNREVGLPPILFAFVPRKAGGTEAFATVKVAGFTLRYREHPFDWARPAFYHVRRTFFGGPVREIVGGAELHPEANGTRVVVWAELQPANAMGQLACRAIGAKSVADCVAACRRFAAYLAHRNSTPYPRHSRRPPAHAERLQQAIERLRQAGAEGTLVDRIRDYVACAPPEDALLMRPFALADAWEVDRMALLRTCLLAASQKVTLLEMRWRTLCPACRGGPPSASHLQELAETVHCKTCNIRFDADFDRSVEVCFSVAPAVRPVRETTYCVGGPRLSPHAAAQWTLRPGEWRETTLDLPAGRYVLSSLQIRTPYPLPLVEDGPAAMRLRLTQDDDEGRIELAERPPCVSPCALWTVQNETRETVVLRLETPEWTNDTATAALVTSLQTFRDQFSSEVLSPGTELAVRQIGILFSDLKGSTAMYRLRGDAPSYSAVREHFAAMRRVITAHDGAVVKTIGDAVMATFHDPADALSAALAIQDDARADASGLVVKLGLHYGPAIAVSANDSLDYFGQTVNLAARLQRASEGGDVVVAASLAADPRVASLLSQPTITTEPFEAAVRGLEEPIRMLRVRPI